MSEGGFLEQKPRSPASLVIVLAVHGAAITALALSKMEVPPNPFVPTILKNIPLDKPPPETPPEPVPEPQVRPKSQLDTPEPIVPKPPRQDPVVLDLPMFPQERLRELFLEELRKRGFEDSPDGSLERRRGEVIRLAGAEA